MFLRYLFQPLLTKLRVFASLALSDWSHYGLLTLKMSLVSLAYRYHALLCSTLLGSNVAAALWNVIEAELGFVAGNVPLMGPLFGKLRHNKSSSGTADPPGSGRGGPSSTSVQSTRQIFRSKGQFPPGEGFERMPDDHRGRLFTSAAPTGKSAVDNIEMMGLPMHGIKVQTDLEQNVGSRDDSPAVSFEQSKAY